LDVYLKRFACVRRLHAALDIVDELVGQHALNLDHIDSIDVVGSRFIAESAIYNPASVVLAQTSMPYAIAILLKFGKVTEELIGTHLDDPEIHVLAGKIRVGEEEFFNRLMEEKKGLWGAAKVTLTTKFGEIHSKTLEYALGERENPLPPQILKKKFMTLATESIDEGKAKDIFEKLADFTLISNVGDIVSELFQS
jgi:2-methylcitrate dehydratase PrpD